MFYLKVQELYNFLLKLSSREKSKYVGLKDKIFTFFCADFDSLQFIYFLKACGTNVYQ